MVTGERPWKGMAPLAVLYKVANEGERPSIPKHVSPWLAKLIGDCWDAQAVNRPTALQFRERLLAQGE